MEITVEPSHIAILSYAGPDRSISAEMINAAKKLKARRYRNRRLGDFLKELDLTEGRATGIPTIQKALKDNGSASATIDTDDDRTYFLITIPCLEDMVSHSAIPLDEIEMKDFDDRLLQILGQSFVKVQELVYQSDITNKPQLLQILEQLSVKVWNKSKKGVDKMIYSRNVIELIECLKIGSSTIKSLGAALNWEDTIELRRKFINPLIEMEYISMTMPDKPTSSKQEYKLTAKGYKLFE